MTESSKKTTKKGEEYFVQEEIAEQNKTKTLTISLHINDKNSKCESAVEKKRFEVETVAFVMEKLKEFFHKKQWHASPAVATTTKGRKEINVASLELCSCSMRDVLEDFRFFLRQHFADRGEKAMPAFQYTTQSSLSAMATALGFRVVKPQNKFALRYYMAVSPSD